MLQGRASRAALCLALVAAACTPAATPVPPTPSAEALPADGLAGPLALHRTNGFMEALTHGKLLITDRCTFLVDLDGARVTLAWPSDRTAWDAATSTILFKNTDGEVVGLHDGDQLTLGGGGSSLAEGGGTGPDWARKLAWVVPPALECLEDERWEVGEVVELGAMRGWRLPG